jgi:ribonuclease VapC
VIVIDSSAIIAILRQEDDFAQRIADDDDPIMSAANVVETSIVLHGLRNLGSDKAARWLDDFIETAGIRIEAVTPDQARLARSAHLRFGKGTGHGAALNFGDCFAYGPAMAMDPRCFARETTSRSPILILPNEAAELRASTEPRSCAADVLIKLQSAYRSRMSFPGHASPLQNGSVMSVWLNPCTTLTRLPTHRPAGSNWLRS